MTYLIDTNIFIILLKKKGPDGARIAERLRREPDYGICTSSIVEAELWSGAAKYEVSSARRQTLTILLAPYRILSFNSACVPHYAAIRHHLEKLGRIIGGNDLLIAATALAHNLTVVTHNGAEFARVPGLKWEDWA